MIWTFFQVKKTIGLPEKKKALNHRAQLFSAPSYSVGDPSDLQSDALSTELYAGPAELAAKRI